MVLKTENGCMQQTYLLMKWTKLEAQFWHKYLGFASLESMIGNWYKSLSMYKHPVVVLLGYKVQIDRRY